MLPKITKRAFIFPRCFVRTVHVGHRKMSDIADHYNGKHMIVASEVSFTDQSFRSHPHSSNRRHWPRLARRLHARSKHNANNTLGLSILTYRRSSPPFTVHRQTNTNSVSLQTWQTPRNSTTRSTKPSKCCSITKHRSANNHSLQCSG